jgi:hypothetical protein
MRTMPYWHDDIGSHFFGLMQGVDALLLGRAKFELTGTNTYPTGVVGLHYARA